jgi:hypothetical protein
MHLRLIRHAKRRWPYLAFVAVAGVVTWLFFERVADEPAWTLTITWVQQIPRPVSLVCVLVCAAINWPLSSAVRPPLFGGALAGFVTVVASSLLASLFAGVFVGQQPWWNVIFFGILFHPQYLSAPGVWIPMLGLPVFGAAAALVDEALREGETLHR